MKRRGTRTISLNQFQLSSIAMMAGAFVVGCYFTLSQVLIPMIRALTETTTEMPVDVAFNRGVADILAGYDDGGGATFVLSSEVKLATSSSWWTTDFTKKKLLTVKNLSSVSLATQSATTQQITINTKALYDAGGLKANCEDLRIVFVATTSANMRLELPRSYSVASGATNCSDSTATTIAFPLQEPLWANGGTDSNYELYYSNSSATDPAYTDQGYSITRQDGSTASATLVCPFNGSTTCVGGETPTTATGAIRYSGTKSALQFDGVDDYVSSTLDKDAVRSAFTLEAWIKLDNLAYNPGGVVSNGSPYTTTLHYESGGSGSFQVKVGGTYYSVGYSGLQAGNWYHLAGTYTSGNMSVWVNGVLNNTRSDVVGIMDAGTAGQTYRVAQAFTFGGIVDEVRVSDSVRYISTFTPQTAPFETDTNTKLLYHFDENGDDPRLTGKAIDSSGNSNHGTIIGAKYVSGLVGVDSSTTNTGALSVQTTAGHLGVFIEEGTTNLITNPSFENATAYNTNWSGGYLNYATASATFTAGMAKRNSAGPFAAGAMIQTNPSVDPWVSDAVYFAHGNNLGKNFRDNIDFNQGSIVFWITPEWSGNDGQMHYFLLQASHGYIRLYKNTSNQLVAYLAGSTVTVDISSWTAGNTYLVTARWDTRNKLDTTNYASISIGDTHTFGGASTADMTSFTPGGYMHVGSYDAASSYRYGANALVEGFTIYRRPLFDGAYGIDVGNGDEINQIYNSGTGKDPTLVTGSWDVVFALPTNASAGTLTAGTGHAWTHPHVGSLLYTSSTNTGGFMMNGTYTSDGFLDAGTPTSVGALATGEKVYVGGYKYTSDAANEGIYRAFAATNGGDYVLRAVGHSDGICAPQIKITRADGTTEITHLNGTTTSTRAAPNVYIFTWEAPSAENEQVQLINTAVSGTCFWHQVEILNNKINNPSMESGSGDPWTPTGWGRQNMVGGETSQELSVVHSGNSALKINPFNHPVNACLWLNFSSSANKFVSLGGFFRGTNPSSSMWGLKDPVSGGRPQHLLSGNSFLYPPSTADWKSAFYVGRISGSPNFGHCFNSDLTNTKYTDDNYVVELSDVSISATPASSANSTETSGLRVDGGDTLSQSIPNWSTSSGSAKFKFTPRHGFDIADKFGVTNPIIASMSATTNNDYLKLYKQSATVLRLEGKFNGTTVTADWSSPTLTAGTTYTFDISYARGNYLTLKVDGTQRAQTALGTEIAFGNAPTIAYFGSDGQGNNQYDGTITSFVTLGTTENFTAPYYKFGSKSVKLVTYDREDEYLIAVTPSASAAHTLSAYVYDGTSGNVGGTISSSVAQLASPSATMTTTYTDMGGGWWRLTASPTLNIGTYQLGVQVKTGKTVYVDGVQLEQKAYATTYADGSLGTGYTWSGTANASSGVRSGEIIKYPASGVLSLNQGTVAMWVKPNWSSTDGNLVYYLYSSFYDNDNWIILARINSVLQAYIKTPTTSHILSYSLTGKDWNGKWKHFAMGWKEGSDLTLFIDGVSAGNPITGITVPVNMATTQGIGIRNDSDGFIGNSSISDFRLFNQALSSSEISNLYNSGLQTHSSGTEAVDRYQASGTYTSPVIDLGANGAWGATPWSVTNILNTGGISYFTRSSPDNSTWSSWEAVTGSVGEGSWNGSIVSNPRRYFQWKANLTASADKSQSPRITALDLDYVEDSTPPVNPSSVALGYTTAASASATLVNNQWYNYATPKFTWEAAVDDPAAGQSSSGVDGYHVLLTTNPNATPSASLASPCYRFAESDDRVFSVGTAPGTCTLTDADYYLRVQTKDNSGNVSDPVTLFTYRYDGTSPRSPVSVSSTTVGYTSQNEFSFYWPPASDQGLNQSGLAYYEYKTGATEGAFSGWTRSNEPGEELVTITSNITAYQEGQNFFFVRTVDFAGNVSAEISNLGVSPFYYNESAPTAPENVVISPTTSSDSQAAENIFTVIWDKPASYSGELAKYYYCVNCTPSVETMSQTTSVQTADRTLTNIALATQQGKNTFYLVAEDNNINTDTGRGNVNFEAYATAEFYASTIAPGAPTNLTISDASDRDAEVWRLTLAWKQAVTGGTPNFYAIHRSTDGITFAKIGETTSTAYTDADLAQSQIYYYKVYAIDNANSTSLASNTVTLAPEGKYTTPPLAGGSPNVTAGSTVATITWSTGRVAYGAVEYGKSTDYEQSVAETVAVANHSIKLTGLTPGTVYHYRVQALDESVLMGYDRENAYSSDHTFTTSATPTISNVTTSDLTLSSVVVNWSAVSLASASIEYGTSTAYGSSVAVGVGSSGTYSTKLASLANSTTYHFRIRAVDIDGTDITSDDYEFTTLTFPKVTAVVFKTDQAQNATAINVAWSTNVPTTASVEYQAVKIDPSFANDSEINYNSSTVLQGLSQTELARLPVVPLGISQYLDRSTISNRHVVQITNLSDSSLYVFTIRGRDEYGNQAVSEPIRYVTGADTKPPLVENLVIETPIVGEGVESKAEIVLSFTTDEPAYSQVLWGAGTGSEYPQATQTTSEVTDEHVIVLRDLKPTSTYHLKIKTTDQSGNISETEDTVVVTPTAQAAAFELILKNLEGIFGFLGLK